MRKEGSGGEEEEWEQGINDDTRRQILSGGKEEKWIGWCGGKEEKRGEASCDGSVP